MKQPTFTNDSAAAAAAAAAAAKIAADLAMQTATKAAELATVAATTATALAAKTAETTAIISNDIGWMKQSLSSIQQTLKEMTGVYITKPIFDENQKMTDDHEKRLRDMERKIQLWAGGLAIIAFGFPLLLKFFNN
jgi:flavorubredoxin